MAIREEKAKNLLEQISEAYRGRSVFVTGADGFVGSHLTETLLLWGARVAVLVRRSPQQLRNIAHLKDRLQILQADVRDYAQVLAAIKSWRGGEGSIIFHLAAQAHVGDSWEKPEETLKTNLLGTLNLLSAIRELDLHLFRFEYAGSSEEYGSFDASRSQEYGWRADGGVLLDERSPLNPKSIYATSKVAADFLSRNFYDAHGLPALVTRMFNNFGPRQSPRFVTGTVITQALECQQVEIGHPNARRDFTYIEDGVRGHLLTAMYGEPGQVYVFGQGRNTSIGKWAELILDLGCKHGFWNQRELVICPERFRPGRTDNADLLANSTRLKDLCGWQPTVGWEEGIVNTIAWYAENRATWKGLIDWQLS